MAEPTAILVYSGKCNVEGRCINNYVTSFIINSEAWSKYSYMCHVVNTSEDN